MTTTDLVTRAARTAATGVVGVATFNVLKGLVTRVRVHEAVVAGTVWGLRGLRGAERGAEAARLRAADVVAEAKERIGEQASPPGPASSGAHDHEH